jgi:3-methyladenine DNA glycosylase AlkD
MPQINRLKLSNLKSEMRCLASREKSIILQRFFKTGKGDYGEGDKFLGIVVPVQRKIVRKYFVDLTLSEVLILLKSQFHEERLTALLILVAKYEKGKINEQKKIFNAYLKNIRYINNWDLVDLTAYEIVGDWLENKDQRILFKLANSKNIWEKRIAMVSTFCYIKKGKSEMALQVAEILLFDKHDLIQKAVGWMLREVGKRCGIEKEEQFLMKYFKTMSRTTLRYAIERMPEKKRKFYLNRKMTT